MSTWASARRAFSSIACCAAMRQRFDACTIDWDAPTPATPALRKARGSTRSPVARRAAPAPETPTARRSRATPAIDCPPASRSSFPAAPTHLHTVHPGRRRSPGAESPPGTGSMGRTCSPPQRLDTPPTTRWGLESRRPASLAARRQNAVRGCLPSAAGSRTRSVRLS